MLTANSAPCPLVGDQGCSDSFSTMAAHIEQNLQMGAVRVIAALDRSHAEASTNDERPVCWIYFCTSIQVPEHMANF